ncbi:MAG TPA: HEPN domain-containing protein [Acidilobales archaeon]|nr:MAG: DNA-binding protein [Desulfurococcales archaeon ex4484_42]RLG83178.1 MAG: DNA-binding protein [Thermoprotei archaeon]HDD26895.1 HEPN domain-containing protein [Acidilobales archaeon]
MVKLEEYELLLRRSRMFYETALMQIDRGFYDLAVFSFEQSLQLFLKAVLLKLGVDFPRTHSIRKLLELIYKISKNEKIAKLLKRYSLELGFLEDAYITSRYVMRVYNEDEVRRVKEVIDEVIKVVREVVS